MNRDPAEVSHMRLLLAPVATSVLLHLLISPQTFWVKAVGTIALVMGARPVGRLVAAAERWASQFRRDETAFGIVSDVLAGRRASGPFFVYLRPFAITGTVRAETDDVVHRAEQSAYPSELYSPDTGELVESTRPLLTLPLLPSEFSAADDSPEFETMLARAVDGMGSFIALGHPGESTGAGRTEVDESIWRAAVSTLIANSSGVIVVPSLQPGTRWEIEELSRQFRVSDSVFVMLGWVGDPESLARWDGIRRGVRPILDLPPHTGVVSLFAYDAESRRHIAVIDGTVSDYGPERRPHVFLTTEAIRNALVAVKLAVAPQNDKITKHLAAGARRAVDLVLGRTQPATDEDRHILETLAELPHAIPASIIERSTSFVSDAQEDFIYETSDSEIKRLVVRWEMRDSATDGIAVYALFEYRREGGRLAGFHFEELAVEARSGHMSTASLPELPQPQVQRTTYVSR